MIGLIDRNINDLNPLDMKKIILTLAISMTMGLCATAQSNTNEVDIETNDNVKLEIITPAEPVKETKQQIKEREKRLRELNDDVAFAKASNSMRRGYFVFLAENIQIGNTGYRHYDFSPNSNFILVQDEDGIVQYALNMGNPGINGLGGWTGKGTVRNKKIEYKDNGDVFMTFRMVSGQINADIDITLFHNSKHAVAHIYGGRPITMHGEIRPYRDADHR